MHELRERNWSSFFREPVMSQLFSAPEEKQSPTRGHVMRMPSREMGEYGILPETDPFIVVVCGVCKGAVKPQGLRKHIHRHNTGVAADSTSLVNLITPCSVSVSALKYDPKADNSNSSTSSVYNMTTGGVGGETTSSSSSGDASSSILPASFQDFSALNSAGTGASPPATLLSGSVGGTATAHKSSSSSSSNSASCSSSLGKGNGGGGKPTATLKLKLTKSGLKGSSSSSSASSSSSRSVSESPSSFLAAETTKCSLRPSSNTEASSSSPPTPSTASEACMAPSASTGGKKLSLKEREYDANKHCGVILVDTGKHCTRTLTCKSHALSLRRQVAGRSMSFDQLLSDHRAMRALLASGKAPPPSAPLPPPQATHTLPPPPPALPTGHEGAHHSSSKKRELSDVSQQRHRRSSHSPEQPPAKKMQMERNISGGGGSYRKSHSHHHHHPQSAHIKSEPAEEGDVPQDESFRGPGDVPVARPRFEVKPFHENGLALHDAGQLVASSNGGYFLKSEPQMGPSSDLMKSAQPDGVVDCGDKELKELATPAPTIITVPLTMLANVMYVNGRNCILEPPPQLSGADEENENRPVGGEKGRHVEVVDGGERRRYLTLSSGRQQRATNRLRLNVIRTEETAVEQKNGAEEGVTAQDYPGIDTWFHQIPKPTYVNCFKLCKLGSSAVLSKRYLNIRRSLIMNMTANQGLVGSPAGVAALNRSNSQTGAGSSPVGGVDKVNNFHAERIKV